MVPFTSPVGSNGRLIDPQYPSYVELQYFSVTVPTVMVFGGEGAACAADAPNASATTPAATRTGAGVEESRRLGIVNPCRCFFFGGHSRMGPLTASTARVALEEGATAVVI